MLSVKKIKIMMFAGIFCFGVPALFCMEPQPANKDQQIDVDASSESDELFNSEQVDTIPNSTGFKGFFRNFRQSGLYSCMWMTIGATLTAHLLIDLWMYACINTDQQFVNKNATELQDFSLNNTYGSMNLSHVATLWCERSYTYFPTNCPFTSCIGYILQSMWSFMPDEHSELR